MEISLLEKKLAEAPIELPDNPFWEVFKRFGRDEATSGVFNIGGTLLGKYALHLGDLGLSVSGPIVEKIGLMYWYFKDAANVYRTTPKEERKNRLSYFANAFRQGWPTLAEDLTVHDPMYSGLLYAGLKNYPETPIWMLSATSFIAAVLAVSGIEVGFKEMQYKKLKRDFNRAGFGLEKYLESRMEISSEVDPNYVLEAVSKEFGLSEPQTWHYDDLYFTSHLPEFNGREPKLRLRRRTKVDGDGVVQTAQVVYTKATEIAKREISQFRYFPIAKDKIYFLLEQQMPSSLDEIENQPVRNALKRFNNGAEFQTVSFDRTYANNPETVLVSADHIDCVRPFNVVELKVYRGKENIIKEAIRYVLYNFPVVQTTHDKLDLVNVGAK